MLLIFFLYLQLVVDGARVGNWACVNFCRGLNDSVVDKFCSDLVTWCRTSGVVIYIFVVPLIALSSNNILA
jgi:eukaryotic translation initiation factor 2C